MSHEREDEGVDEAQDDVLDDFSWLDDDDDEGDALAPSELMLTELGLDEFFGVEIGSASVLAPDLDGMDEEDTNAVFALELPEDDRSGDLDGGTNEEIALDDIGGEDEYGWTEPTSVGSETGGGDASMIELPDLAPLAGDDRGEEGVEETIDLGVEGDDGVPNLPVFERGLDDDLDDAELIALDSMETAFETTLLEASAIDPAKCVLGLLGPRGEEIACVDAGPPALAAGARLYRVHDARVEAFEPRGPFAARDVVSVTSVGASVVVGTRSAGAFRSAGDGAPWSAGEGLAAVARSACSFHVYREAISAHLWGQSGAGELFRSSDGGATWTGPIAVEPVLAVATPADGGVVLLTAVRGAHAAVARSDDGGEHWSFRSGPPVGQGRARIAAFSAHVIVSVESEVGSCFSSEDGGETWARLPGIPRAGAIALVAEADGLSLYAAHDLARRSSGAVARYGAVVRHRLSGGDSADVVLDGADRVIDVAARVEGSSTTVYVATDAGLVRARIETERAR